MTTHLHEYDGELIVEIVSDTVLIRTGQEALEVLMSATYGTGASKVILHQKNLSEDFFALKTGLAGEVLQKFVNYRVQVAIVGDFKNLASESLQAFIRESNRGRHVFFVDDLEAAKQTMLRATP